MMLSRGKFLIVGGISLTLTAVIISTGLVAPVSSIFKASEEFALPPSSVTFTNNGKPEEVLPYREIDISELPYFRSKRSGSAPEVGDAQNSKPSKESGESAVVTRSSDETVISPTPDNNVAQAGGSATEYAPPPIKPTEPPLGSQGGYLPSAEITFAADRINLTSYGRELFIGTSPEFAGEIEIIKFCDASTSDDKATGGCYLPGSHKIYVYNIPTDHRQAHRDAVVAHELLHAAWRFYPQDKRDVLEAILKEVIDSLPSDHMVNRALALYDPEEHDIPNEMHSFVGTIVENIPPELESHYAKYFVSRATIASNYNAFRDIESIERKKVEVNLELYREAYNAYASLVKEYNSEAEQLQIDIETFNNNINNYSQSEFTSRRDALLERQSEQESKLLRVKELKSEMESLYEIYAKSADDFNNADFFVDLGV